ncbi:MAG TPA: hypothetical protein VH092_39240 [Urbifossiella sp.]|jgi:hypothetical protein|nr:hypothetical protein [Urbifossiella sp.]
MTESDWLAGTDGDDMLQFVADRLTPRQWAFLAAAHVRRLWDTLPEGPFRVAVEAVETADPSLSPASRAELGRQITAAEPGAAGAAEATTREVVKTADPDAADVEGPVLARPNQAAPAFPLFKAASRHARNAIDLAADTVTDAAEAVRRLLEEPGEQTFSRVRRSVDRAAETRNNAARAANLARRFKQEGDELADRAAAAKNKRLEAAKAEEMVRKGEESAGLSPNDEGPGDDRLQRAAEKLLTRGLREVVGNPFREPRFEPVWRTEAAVGLARSIFADRAWDRLTVLADALLDADCDEEQLLRHLRGTEKGVKEPPQHVRGCWAVELVLGRWQPLPPPDPNAPTRRTVDDDFWDSIDDLDDDLA